MRPSTWRLRDILVGLAVTFGLASLGCAAMFNDNTDEVSVTSDPEGATVVVDGQERAQTPAKLELTSTEARTITIKKPGYEHRTFRVHTDVELNWIVLDVAAGFLAGPIPVIIDGATGAWYTLERDEISVTLDESSDKGTEQFILHGAERLDRPVGPLSRHTTPPLRPAIPR